MKIYELTRNDLFCLRREKDGTYILSNPLRYHGLDGMYARITTPEFSDLDEAFKAERVTYISCGAEVEKLETSGTTSGGAT